MSSALRRLSAGNSQVSAPATRSDDVFGSFGAGCMTVSTTCRTGDVSSMQPDYKQQADRLQAMPLTCAPNDYLVIADGVGQGSETYACTLHEFKGRLMTEQEGSVSAAFVLVQYKLDSLNSVARTGTPLPAILTHAQLDIPAGYVAARVCMTRSKTLEDFAATWQSRGQKCYPAKTLEEDQITIKDNYAGAQEIANFWGRSSGLVSGRREFPLEALDTAMGLNAGPDFGSMDYLGGAFPKTHEVDWTINIDARPVLLNGVSVVVILSPVPCRPAGNSVFPPLGVLRVNPFNGHIEQSYASIAKSSDHGAVLSAPHEVVIVKPYLGAKYRSGAKKSKKPKRSTSACASTKKTIHHKKKSRK